MTTEAIDGGKPSKRLGRITGTRILKVADKGLLGAFIGSIIAVYILDAIFFMAWAPEWWLVPVFLLIGVAIRSVAVFHGAIMQVVSKDATVGREAKTLRALAVAAGIICLVPALSFFAGGHYNQTHGSTVAVATEAVSDSNKASRIATLRGQISRIEANRDASVEEANRSIELIADDGVPGISPADNQNIALLRAEIQAYRTDAAAQVSALEAQIGAIEQEKEATQTSSAEAQNTVSPVYAIFEVLGSITGGAPIWAMTILFLFAFLIEAIAFFGLGLYQGLHKFFVEAIQRMELEEEAHEARLEAERSRQLALAEREIAEIAMQAAESRAKTEAMLAGQDSEAFDAIRAAERNLKRAEANSLIADLMRKASAVDPADLASPPQVPLTSPDEIVVTDPPVILDAPPADPPPPPQEPDKPIPGRAGGLGSQHINRASKLENVILVDDNRERNAARDASRQAAE
jgi:hypothetical protein